MKCRDIIQELASYFDEALEPTLRVSIEEHLFKCKNCRIVVDTTKKTIDIFCNSEPAPLPEDTRLRLRDALKKRLRGVRV